MCVCVCKVLKGLIGCTVEISIIFFDAPSVEVDVKHSLHALRSAIVSVA